LFPVPLGEVGDVHWRSIVTLHHVGKTKTRLKLWSPHLLFALRLAVLGGLVAVVLGLADHLLSWPFLTAAIGPTAYFFIAHPKSSTSTVRNASIGHGVAIAAGLASLAVFGLWNAPSVATTGHLSIGQAGSAAVALAATLFILHLLQAHHAPAAASTVLVATGLARPIIPLAGLVVGLAAVIVAAPLLAAVPLPAGTEHEEA
jgi:hypothetical protein